MKQKPNKELFNEIVLVLKDLNKKYPAQGIARHIADATADYPNLWLMSNKELLFALHKYKTELALNIVDEDEVNAIVKDAENLDTILEKPDEDAMFNVNEQDWL